MSMRDEDPDCPLARQSRAERFVLDIMSEPPDQIGQKAVSVERMAQEADLRDIPDEDLQRAIDSLCLLKLKSGDRRYYRNSPANSLVDITRYSSK